MGTELLDAIRAWHAANIAAWGRSPLRCAAGCDGCVICHVDALLREVDRLTGIIQADRDPPARPLLSGWLADVPLDFGPPGSEPGDGGKAWVDAWIGQDREQVRLFGAKEGE